MNDLWNVNEFYSIQINFYVKIELFSFRQMTSKPIHFEQGTQLMNDIN
jgi:hypothetical protein